MGELAIMLHTPADPHGRTKIGIAGPINYTNTPALRDYLRRLLDTSTSPSPRLLLDMSCCTGLDVAGLLALAVAQHAARLRGGDLHLTDTPPLITRQIRQHRFNELLLHPTPDPHRAPGESRQST